MGIAKRFVRVSLGRSVCVALAACLVVCAAALISGCASPESDTNVLSEIAAGGDHQDWDAVRPKIKGYLLEHPNDILGHYYYGLSYLHLPEPHLTFAEGELLTAQALLERTEDFPAEEAGIERHVFAGRLHRKTALTYMRGYREALQYGLPSAYGQDLLRKANAQVELGLQENPSSGHLKEYATFLRQALGVDKPEGPKIVTKRAGSSMAT